MTDPQSPPSSVTRRVLGKTTFWSAPTLAYALGTNPAAASPVLMSCADLSGTVLATKPSEPFNPDPAVAYSGGASGFQIALGYPDPSVPGGFAPITNATINAVISENYTADTSGAGLYFSNAQGGSPSNTTGFTAVAGNPGFHNSSLGVWFGDSTADSQEARLTVTATVPCLDNGATSSVTRVGSLRVVRQLGGIITMLVPDTAVSAGTTYQGSGNFKQANGSPMANTTITLASTGGISLTDSNGVPGTNPNEYQVTTDANGNFTFNFIGDGSTIGTLQASGVDNYGYVKQSDIQTILPIGVAVYQLSVSVDQPSLDPGATGTATFTLLDFQGRPVPNAGFQASATNGVQFAGGLQSTTLTTDGSGRATVQYGFFGKDTTAGEISGSFNAPNGGTVTTAPNAQVSQGGKPGGGTPSIQLATITGNLTPDQVGTGTFALTDESGQPIPGRPMTLTATGGVVFEDGSRELTVTTDANGLATFTFKLDGTNTGGLIGATATLADGTTASLKNPVPVNPAPTASYKITVAGDKNQLVPNEAGTGTAQLYKGDPGAEAPWATSRLVRVMARSGTDPLGSFQVYDPSTGQWASEATINSAPDGTVTFQYRRTGTGTDGTQNLLTASFQDETGATVTSERFVVVNRG